MKTVKWRVDLNGKFTVGDFCTDKDIEQATHNEMLRELKCRPEALETKVSSDWNFIRYVVRAGGKDIIGALSIDGDNGHAVINNLYGFDTPRCYCEITTDGTEVTCPETEECSDCHFCCRVCAGLLETRRTTERSCD